MILKSGLVRVVRFWAMEIHPRYLQFPALPPGLFL